MVIKMPCAHFTDEKVQNKLQLTQLVTVPVVSYSEPVYCNHVTSPGGRIGRGPQIDRSLAAVRKLDGKPDQERDPRREKRV